jgi:hypothetical protein
MKYPEYSEEELRRFAANIPKVPMCSAGMFRNTIKVDGGTVVVNTTVTFVPDPPVTPQPAPPPWLSQEDPEDMDWEERDDVEPTGD